MKMTNENYNLIVSAFEENKEKVIEHRKDIIESGNYITLDIRVAWDCLRAFVGNKFIIGQYSEGLNDTHITTASVKALKVALGE